jgi:hypothetical protein
VLNRLYIVVGVLAILLLGAAFVMPAFIPWDNYRDRLAEIASGVLGAPVRVEGDIHFTLLPQPRLEFAEVSSGPPDAPSLTVKSVEVEFSLIDFLRDRYTLTRLQLSEPHFEIHVGSDGSVDTGLMLPQSAGQSNISIASAIISDGQLTVSDNRSGESYVVAGISGDLKAEALFGPFSFSGSGAFNGQSYGLRVTTGTLAEDNSTTLSASLRPADETYSLTVDGSLTPGVFPSFSGTMSYRQKPSKLPEGEPDAGRGDMVVTSRVEASPGKVLLGDYTVVPDENRPATRLVGAADLTLGMNMRFNAVISGGVVALPPRDATVEKTVEPYEIVRLLNALPVPKAPDLPGKLGIDIAQLDLRAFSLRNVRLDASAAQGRWTIDELSGDLPGSSKLRLSGRFETSAGRAEFSGKVRVESPRLDVLSMAWRAAPDGNPLFNMPGTIDAKLDLVGETLSISDGQLTLDGDSVGFSAQIGVGSTRDLHITADVDELDSVRSVALLALLPDPALDSSFGVTFPSGEFDFAAGKIQVSGLDVSGLEARGSWDGGVLVLDDFSAADIGGVGVRATLTAFGSLERPELSGTATLDIASADANAVRLVLDSLGATDAVKTRLRPSFPAELDLKLGAPSGEGAQTLEATGSLGSSSLSARADISSGFLRAFDGAFTLDMDIDAATPDELTTQLGLPEGLFPAGQPVHFAAMVDGDTGASLKTTLFAQGGDDSVGFSGDVVVTDPDRPTGKGTLKVALSDPSPVLAAVGADGLSLPALSGAATVEFAGDQSVKLLGIDGSSNDRHFSGQLDFTRPADTGQVSGRIAIESADISSLVRTMVGPAALLSSGGTWPNGPFSIGGVSRTTTGRVEVKINSLAIGDRSIASASFGLDWDAAATRIRDFTGKLGDGSINLEVGVCCSDRLEDKQVSGRVTLTQVAIGDVAPAELSNLMAGKLNTSARFSATSSSLIGVFDTLTGEGSYTVDGLTIANLSPRAVGELLQLDSIVEQEPAELAALVEERLRTGQFAAPQVTGSFTVAGGTLRSPNLNVVGPDGRMFGSVQVRLSDLGLTGNFAIAPPPSGAAPTQDIQPEVIANMGGTLGEPTVAYDASSLVDAIMVRAYEAEVERLEKLRAEDEARKAAEAAEKAAAEEAARKAAEDAAIKAADEAAAKKAAEEEAARKAAEQRAQAEALRRAQEEATKPLDLFGN